MAGLGARLAFFLGAALCLAPLAPASKPWLAYVAPTALVVGMLIALTIGNPFAEPTKRVSKGLLQFAVVMLGFSVDLNLVLRAGRDGLVFALASIAAVFALGFIVQRLIRVRPVTSLLVSTGTAICGGSAIAAMSSVVDAPQEDVSVSIGTVFLLNAAALLIFPPIGRALAMTPHEFGVWSGIAIHDVSSVVGAAASYGEGALDVATAVKLSRVLYLVPIVLIAARVVRKPGAPVAPPWFIGGFLIAALIRSAFEPVAEAAPVAKAVATAGFALSLFLIGAGVSRSTLKSVGFRPMLQGGVLWLAISAGAYVAARQGFG